MLYNSEGNTLSPPFPASSYTKAYSKDNGLYKFDVVPISRLDIDNNAKLKIEDAWVESAWDKQPRMFGKIKIIPQNWCQIIIAFKFQKDTANHFYYFLGKEKIPNRVTYPCNRLDTIKIPLYRQTTAALLSRRQRQAYDSVIFVKK